MAKTPKKVVEKPTQKRKGHYNSLKSLALISKLSTREAPFDEQYALYVCRKVATTQMSIRELCAANPELPSYNTINTWRLTNPRFAEMFRQAKIQQADLLAEEIIDIANTEEDPERARIKIDARKWLATKLLPRIYGDKNTTDFNVNVKHEDALKELE